MQYYEMLTILVSFDLWFDHYQLICKKGASQGLSRDQTPNYIYLYTHLRELGVFE